MFDDDEGDDECVTCAPGGKLEERFRDRRGVVHVTCSLCGHRRVFDFRWRNEDPAIEPVRPVRPRPALEPMRILGDLRIPTLTALSALREG